MPKRQQIGGARLHLHRSGNHEKLGPRHTKHRKAYRLAEGMPEPQRSARKSYKAHKKGGKRLAGRWVIEEIAAALEGEGLYYYTDPVGVTRCHSVYN